MKRRLCVLGATGSIGTQTLEVVDLNRQQLSVVSMTAGDNIELFAEQIIKYRPRLVSVKSEEGAAKLKRRLEEKRESGDFVMPDISYGMEGFVACAVLPEADMVVAAMVGMIGLRPVMEAIRSKKDIALANKETLVTAGHLIMPLAEEYGVRILPVDSEHSAIFQCMECGEKRELERIYLTASGGPFRKYSKEELDGVTVEKALAHPNWSMGKKITIDSATMVNKGLEIIEACWLFGIGQDQVSVLVQPKSVIHSMAAFQDGAVIAQLGTPDMRLPIQYALMYPNRPKLPGERLDFDKITSVTFEKPNTDVLRGIDLARQAFQTGGSMTTVMNAANEFAVARFLARQIRFPDIYRMIEYAMAHHSFIENPSLDDILETEQQTIRMLQTYQF